MHQFHDALVSFAERRGIYMKKICIVTTLWSSINNWIKPFFNEYHKRNIDVTIICNMDKEYETLLKKEFPYVHTYAIDFPRGISFMGSLKSICTLWNFLRKQNFDMIQYSTPNASCYASLAARMAGIPVRLYCQWGMIYVTQNGMKRKILKCIEKMTCRNSTFVQPDSKGNLIFCRNEGFYDETKSCVIWNGSAKGLDLTAYDDTKKDDFSKEIREKYNIKSDDIVIGFVGRLGKEKGCNELFSAFKNIKKDYPSSKLLFVGPIEKENTIDPDLLSYFENCDDIIKTGRVSQVEKYMSAMDIFVLPSYREGFGMSVVEASAMRVPVVVTKYPGPASAMVEEKTGLAVDVKDVVGLETAIRKLLSDKKLSVEMGNAGREFVEASFDQKIFIEKYMKNRMELLGLK